MADGERTAGKAARTGEPARRYAAFVSYSHTDDEIANWLHRRLETYRIPAALVRGRGGRRIGKIFRDRVELSAAHDLGVEIHKALEASDALIVLCSPRSAGSRYVEEEIRFFKQLGRGQQIFAAIVDGEPHAAGKPGREASQECFPRALLYRVGPDGALSSDPEPAEPIAADVRAGKDGRESGALKLIAGLIGVGLDELVQREKQADAARRRRVQLVAAVMAVLAVGAAIAGGFAWLKQIEAEDQRDRATTNEQLAKTNEILAVANEKKANDNFELAELKRREAERNAEEREIQRLLAQKNAVEARGALARMVASRATRHNEDVFYSVAARTAALGLSIDEGCEECRVQLAYALKQNHIVAQEKVSTLPVLNAVMTPDRKQIFITNERAEIYAISTERPHESPRLILRPNWKSSRVEFSSDGSHALLPTGSNTLQAVRLSDGRSLGSFRASELYSNVISASGKYVVTNYNGNLLVSSVGSGTETRIPVNGIGHWITLRESTKLMSFVDSDGISIANILTGQILSRQPVDNAVLVATSADQGSALFQVFLKEPSDTSDHALSPQLILVDLKNGQMTTRPREPNEYIGSAVFGPKGDYVLTGGRQGTVSKYSVPDMSPSDRDDMSWLRGRSVERLFVNDRLNILAMTHGREIIVWDLRAGGRSLRLQPPGLTNTVTLPIALRFVEGRGKLIALYSDGALLCWSVQTRAIQWRIQTHGTGISRIGGSADDSVLVVVGAGGVADIVSAQKGELLTSFSFAGADFTADKVGRTAAMYAIRSVFSPDARWLILHNFDRRCMYDWKRGNRVACDSSELSGYVGSSVTDTGSAPWRLLGIVGDRRVIEDMSIFDATANDLMLAFCSLVHEGVASEPVENEVLLSKSRLCARK